MKENKIKNEFYEKFFEHLGKSERWDAFCIIADHLIDLSRPVNITETGCAREMGSWESDGKSTFVFNWLAVKTGGTATSIDISKENIEYAKTFAKENRFILGDSVEAIRKMENIEDQDLFYFDSYDVTGDYRSPMHHLAELSSSLIRMKSGCLVAVDDCDMPFGKGKYVSKIMDEINAQKIIEGKINLWVKP